MRCKSVALVTKNEEESGFLFLRSFFPAGIYLLKVNGGNTKTRCETCSKLTIKTLLTLCKFIVYFEHISHVALEFLSLTLNI